MGRRGDGVRETCVGIGEDFGHRGMEGAELEVCQKGVGRIEGTWAEDTGESEPGQM